MCVCVRCVYHVVDLWFFNDQISSRATFHRSPSYAFSPPSPLLFLFFPLSLSPFNLLSSFRPFFPSLSLLSASPLASSSISLLFLFPRVSAGQPLLPLSLCRPESPTLLPSPSHSFVLATRQGFTADRTSTGRTRPLPRLISLIYYLSIVIQLRQLFDRSPTVRSPLVINL